VRRIFIGGAYQVWRKRSNLPLRNAIDSRAVPEDLVLYALILVAVGVVSGFAAGLFGIGGGVILVPTFLVLFPRFGAGPTVVMHCAVGTCLALVVPAAIMSTADSKFKRPVRFAPHAT
jgi:hypothetical protein